jgi:hypothetical protein
MYDVVSVNGKRQQKTETLVGVTKKQAEAMLAKRKAAVVAGEYLPCADMTMNELFDRFMQAKEGHPCRDDAAALREFAAALLAAGGRHQEGWQREGCRSTCNLCSMVEAASQRTYGPSCCGTAA